MSQPLKRSDKLKWDSFDELHVIRRVRKILGDWWKIQLHFTDSHGYLRGVTPGKFFNPIHRSCVAIAADAKGFRGCMETVRRTAVERNKTTHLSQCHTGFSTLSVPIVIEGYYLGCIFGDGFVLQASEKEQKQKIEGLLKEILKDSAKVQLALEEIPVLTEKEVHYVTELLKIVVDEVLMSQVALQSARHQVEHLQRELKARHGIGQLIGKSKVMQSIYHLIERVRDASSLVLIQGEGGTGKELIARALHYGSSREKGAFLAVNCGAFNENLLESELFGHVKGSFTGAIKDKIGVFEAANQGTLFLDEIGDMSLPMQVKLLRVLQESTFRPVGSNETRETNARIVCATNKNLHELMEKGLFREDLFYRLNVITLKVPSLRERREDLPELIQHFLESHAKAMKVDVKTPSKACMTALLNYEWPGNVRELENEIERLYVLAGPHPELSEKDLSDRLAPKPMAQQGGASLGIEDGEVHSLKETLEDLEARIIEHGLLQLKGNRSQLAKKLGISRVNLIAKIEKYQLSKAKQAS